MEITVTGELPKVCLGSGAAMLDKAVFTLYAGSGRSIAMYYAGVAVSLLHVFHHVALALMSLCHRCRCPNILVVLMPLVENRPSISTSRTGRVG